MANQFWQELLLSYREMAKPSLLVQNCQEKSKFLSLDWTNPTNQQFLLTTVLEDPLVVRYPPSSLYTSRFIKFYLSCIEDDKQPMNEELLSLYFSLSSMKVASEGEMREVCYKTYRISSNPIEDITVKMANQLDNVGLTSWEAGFFLAEFVTSNPKLFNQKNVLELGSGIGVTGVVLCKKTNPSIVVLSDFTDPVISNLNQNLSLNGIETVDIEEPKEEQKNQVSVIELDWEKFDFKSGFYGKKIDILLVADCVYDFELIDALTAVLHRFLEPSEGSREKVDDIFSCSPCAFVATAIRIPKTFDYFLSRLKEAKIVHVDVSPPAFGFNMDSVFKYDNSGLVLSYLYRVE